MATLFALNQLGVEYNVKLVDCFSGEDFDTNNIASQVIVFYKSDNTRFTKKANLAINTEDPSETLIQYINTLATIAGQDPDTESILDLRGKWEYSGQAILTTGDTFESQQKKVFWVK